jgi:hypothetical protein
MSLTKVTYSMIDGADVNVQDFGATGDGVTDDTVAIQAALDTGNTVVFPEGNYLISSTLFTIPVGGGSPSFPSDYGQKIVCNQVTFTAASGFTGDSILTIRSPDGALEGWANFEGAGNVDYCVKVTSANVTIDRVRPYNFNVAGIFTGNNYGTVITTSYGQGASGATSLIQADNTTGLIVTNPQTFRTSHYLVHVTDCIGFVINGGTPDKNDFGIYASLSMGVINGHNFEGTKYPLYLDRSYVNVEGCRFLSNGGTALSPENSTDGVNLNIGDANSRKAGTFLIRGLSARVEMVGNSISATSVDFEFCYWFTDISGANSNILIGDANQLFLSDLSTNFSLTTQVYPGETTLKVLTNTTNYTVLGAGSSQNRIELDTVQNERGFTITFDPVSFYYEVSKAGYYEFEFFCEIDAASTSAYIDFDLVFSVGNAIVRTQQVSVGTRAPVYFKHRLFMNVGEGIRFQGITDGIAATGILINPQLSIEMLSNF